MYLDIVLTNAVYSISACLLVEGFHHSFKKIATLASVRVSPSRAIEGLAIRTEGVCIGRKTIQYPPSLIFWNLAGEPIKFTLHSLVRTAIDLLFIKITKPLLFCHLINIWKSNQDMLQTCPQDLFQLRCHQPIDISMRSRGFALCIRVITWL